VAGAGEFQFKTPPVPTPCAITLDNIFTIQRSALGESITVLSLEKLLLVFAAIRKAFDMS